MGNVFIYEKDAKKNLAYLLTHDEFKCKCSYDSCHFTLVNPQLILAWNKVRKEVNRAMYVTSGFRCQKHNEDIGGAKNSRHTKGSAVDIMFPAGIKKDKFIKICQKHFDLVIPYHKNNFVHCHIVY